jgi:hypothetical protein
MRVRRGVRFLPALGAASLTLAHLLTAVAFRRKTREIFTRLENMAAAEVQAAPVPAIIESFASRAVGRTPVPRAVRLRQTGEMRAAPDSPWRPFSAEQVIRISRPGFAWVARMQVVPLLSAQIRECYIDDQGLLEARLWGSLPLARLAGPETSKGELMRYLAELIWAPRAMRHNPALSWREIDAATVEVSAASPGGPARVRLIFEDGDIARIEADDRPRAAGRRIVPTRWEGCCGDYREMEGCRIPTRAAVSWLLDDGPFEYWRGKVTAYGKRRL